MDRSSSAGADRPRWIGALAVLTCTWVIGTPTRATAQTDVASVNGRVVNTDGDPLAGICVNVGPSGPGSITLADGTYLVDGIEPGDHTVQFSDCNAIPIYVTSWYLGRATQDQADTVTVQPNESLPLSEVTLAAGVAVAGTVTDGSGAPLAGINVSVNPYDGPGPSTGAQSQANGSYRTGALPDGDYRVQFDDPTDAFANQYWNGRPVWNDADRLTLQVANGIERPGVDATLVQAAAISGMVTDDGGPVADICVNANTPTSNGGWGGVGGTRTLADGTYALSGLPPSIELRIQFQDCAATPAHVEQWWNRASGFNMATPLHLAAGQTEPGIDAHLATGVAVSGTVTDGSGNPLRGINVNVNPYDGPGPSTGTQTQADGTYRTGALPDGDYRVQFDDPTDVFANEYWNGHTVWNDADRLRLHVADGGERSGIDATLAPAATITGTVTDDVGPVADICVNANTPASNGGWAGVAGTRTGSAGGYTLAGLPPSLDLRIQFQDCAATPSHIEQWWNGAPDFNRSTSVILVPGEVHSGVDAHLATGIRVAGIVTDEEGNPLPNIDVSVNPDGQGRGGYGRTDSSGHYVTSAVARGI